MVFSQHNGNHPWPMCFQLDKLMVQMNVLERSGPSSCKNLLMAMEISGITNQLEDFS